MRRVYIENLGCSKNQVDAEIILASLKGNEWIHENNPVQADLIIVNTCGFIKEAKEEAVNTILHFTTSFPAIPVIAAGCLAQRYSADLKKQIPELSGIFGNMNPARIIEMTDDVFKGAKPVFIPEKGGAVPVRDQFFSFKRSAYVKIAEGCNNNCRFCAIPLIKGGVKSRTIEDVVLEIEALLAQGIFEINLVAQDLSGFGNDRNSSDLIPLLKKIKKIEAKCWFRLLYIHPDRFETELLDTIADDSQILPYFDLPFQHASRKVLEKMGRKGDSESYLTLVKKIREKLPNAVIRSTFMTGFSSEDDKAFSELRQFQEDARLDWLGTFVYSPEEGTPAFDDTPSIVRFFTRRAAGKRQQIVQARQQEISAEQMKRYVSKEFDVLVEEKIEEEDLALGRTWFQAPEVDGSTVVLSGDYGEGDIVRVKIVKTNGFDLEAVPVEK